MFSGRRRCGVPTDKLLELEGLTKYFYKPMGLLGRRKQVVQAVDRCQPSTSCGARPLDWWASRGCGKTTLGTHHHPAL